MEAELVARQLDDAPALGRVAAYRCQYLWSVGELGPALEAGERRSGHCRCALTTRCSSPRAKLYQALVFLAQGDAQRAADLLSDSLQELDRRFGTTAGHDQPRDGDPAARRSRSSPARSPASAASRKGSRTAKRRCVWPSPTWSFGLATALAGLGILYVRKADAHIGDPPPRAGPRGIADLQRYQLDPDTRGHPRHRVRACRAGGRGRRPARARRGPQSPHGIVATLSLWRTYLGDAYLKAGRIAEAGSETRRALGECRARLEHGYEPWALHVVAGILAASEPPDYRRRARALHRGPQARRISRDAAPHRPVPGRARAAPRARRQRGRGGELPGSRRSFGRRARNPPGVARRDVMALSAASTGDALPPVSAWTATSRYCVGT